MARGKEKVFHFSRHLTSGAPSTEEECGAINKLNRS